MATIGITVFFCHVNFNTKWTPWKFSQFNSKQPTLSDTTHHHHQHHHHTLTLQSQATFGIYDMQKPIKLFYQYNSLGSLEKTAASHE